MKKAKFCLFPPTSCQLKLTSTLEGDGVEYIQPIKLSFESLTIHLKEGNKSVLKHDMWITLPISTEWVLKQEVTGNWKLSRSWRNSCWFCRLFIAGNIAKLRENLRKAHNVSGKEGDWNFGDNGICSAIAIQLEALQVTLHNKLVPTSSLLSLDFFPTSPPHLNCFRGFHMKSLFIQTPRAAEK